MCAVRMRPGSDHRGLAQVFKSAIAAAALTWCMPSHALAQAGATIELTPMKLEGAFMGKKKNKPAKDISGIACMPPVGARRTCLLVNDENKNAQFAAIEGSRLIVGDPIVLIGDEPDPDMTLGRKPKKKKTDCPNGRGDFAEFDGEGVAYSEPYFYVTGSHGCSRKSGEFRLSSFMLTRIRVDRQGRPADGDGEPLSAKKSARAVETTYRVSDLLRHAEAAANVSGKVVTNFFGKDLVETANGLNIEGIAVDGDKVWFGLRAPVDGGKAFLVGGSASDLFRKGHSRSQATPEVIDLKLENLGIRDVAMLPSGRILVLAGAAHGSEAPFQLFIVDTKAEKPVAKPLGELRKVEQSIKGETKVGKAEAATVLDPDQGRIVVLFDGLIDGAPQLGEVSLQ